MKKGTRTALPLLGGVALIMALATAGWTATPSQVTSLAASASGTTVSVSGTASFGGQDPVLVGEDGLGDNAGGAEAGALGLDIDKLFISQPDANVGSLLFTMKLAGLTGGGLPEAFQYNWDISINGGPASGGANWSIKSMRSGQGATGQAGNLNAWASLTSCVPNPTTGGFTCTRQAPDLPVVYDSNTGEIRITVPLSRIGASAGSTIDAWPRNGEPVWVRTSAAGALTGGVSADETTHDQYTVPGKSVMAGLAPAGSAVPFTTAAFLGSGGSFTASLAAPSSGAFDVAARACFAGNCGSGTTQVTV